MSQTTVYVGGKADHVYDSGTGISSAVPNSSSQATQASDAATASGQVGAKIVAGTIPGGTIAPPGTINSANTTSSTGVIMPTPAPASKLGTNTMTALSGVAGAGTTTGTTNGTTTTTTTATDADTAFQNYLKSIQAPTSTADIYSQAKQDAGTVAAQQRVDILQGQLNAITAKAQADKLSTTGQGRGIPEAIIGGQQAEIDKEAAIQALPVAAQLAAAQNDLTRAQDNLDTLFKLRSEDAQNKVTYNNSVIQAVYNYADAKQKTQLAAIQKTNDQNFSLLTNNLNYAQSLATAAISNGQPSVAAALMKLDHNDPNYAANIANLAKGIVVTKASTGGDTKAQQQADDVAQAIIDFQTQIKNKGWAGANPDAYDHYRTQLITKYGASAALQLDKDMQTLGITVG